jgi:hypothetical protein
MKDPIMVELVRRAHSNGQQGGKQQPGKLWTGMAAFGSHASHSRLNFPLLSPLANRLNKIHRILDLSQ